MTIFLNFILRKKIEWSSDQVSTKSGNKRYTLAPVVADIPTTIVVRHRETDVMGSEGRTILF